MKTIIVPVSGGKDSTTCLVKAIKRTKQRKCNTCI